jgi:hypothetical protein
MLTLLITTSLCVIALELFSVMLQREVANGADDDDSDIQNKTINHYMRFWQL